MQTYDQIKRVKDQYIEILMSKAHVVGVGIGFAERGGIRTEEMSLIVMVDRKLPAEALGPDDVIPSEIEGVKVDVQMVGEIGALN